MAKSSKIGRSASTGQFVLGRAAFAKISAVEGLRASKTMNSDFKKLDAENATPEQRRKYLASKYGN
ncbi:hypothetical protein L5876_00610 [Hyphobacterium sp. SN044]|uniref:hypothetical protein n=1 Tax=Hyphobacterium sp. SN044 TaxID=2912575 RepID=UPI001F2887A1|nr:hypothetical protein [Hyphobacterium sp. SN044]MCF8878314.1 hypothetical protein [Hyphobacterium sp. SN044]